ncbi:MAG: signal peptide peptidase SppA [Syntrophales bacterium]|nr:signal peptide peptidase SppA [Syntrophales bacterium]
MAIILLFVIAILFFILIFSISSLSGKRQSFSLAEKVGVVTVDGIITDSKEIVGQLNDFAKDDAIRAVVLRIDSPGGGVAPSEEIYSAVSELKKKKPVVASMGSIAASGGYLVACAANRIVANPGTVTGSISAVMHFANIESLMKKIGVHASVIKSGKFKDIGSPAREMTQEERTLLQGVVDDIYDYLLDVIAKDRKMKKEDLRLIADGRIFTGRQAKKAGLVDDLGDLEAALDLAGKLAHAKGKPEAIYPAKKKVTFWEMIFQTAASTAMTQLKVQESRYYGLYFVYDPAASVHIR